MPITKREVMEAAARGEGCLGKAADDEPVFVLRAQDSLAPGLIRVWADTLENAKRVPEKVRGARTIAVKMIDWQRATQRFKLPD